MLNNISNDRIVSSQSASGADFFKYIVLAIGLSVAYLKLAKHYEDKKKDPNLSDLEDESSSFQLRTSFLLATLVASSTWFFGFSGLVATFAFAATAASVELFRFARSWLANKFYEQKKNDMSIKVSKGIALSESEMEFNKILDPNQRIDLQGNASETSEMLSMGKQAAGSLREYFKHFMDRRTYPIPFLGGTPEQVRNYYAGWALYQQRSNAPVSDKASGKEEDKGETPNMFADGKFIEGEFFAKFAHLMGVSIKIYQTEPESYAHVGAYRENCSFHCLIHCIASQEDARLRSMFKSNPLYPIMLDKFYEYYGLGKSEDQNVNIDNFIALLRKYSHPQDREFFLGQFLREFFKTIEEVNQLNLNLSISDSCALQYFSEEDNASEQEKIALHIYHIENGGGHFNMSYGDKKLDSEHNEKLKKEQALLSSITDIMGTDERTKRVKEIVQQQYSEIQNEYEHAAKGSPSRGCP